MNIQHRIELMGRLGKYLAEGGPELDSCIEKAYQHNNWFTPEFTRTAINNIALQFLNEEILHEWVSRYELEENKPQKNIGIVMAGNIPLVGFHDILCTFISGHQQTLKLSSKDTFLPRHLIDKLIEMNPSINLLIRVSDTLKDCEAYIATGSNQSARYFDYYFSRYPHIIRHNRTSIAVLTGNETEKELELLADDINLYFGLGCRNVTKILTPEGYDFTPLLATLNKYAYFTQHSKYMSNYDYRLAILILNRQKYLSNGSLLITEDTSVFSPISVLHYETYKDQSDLEILTNQNRDIQCIVGNNFLPFGKAQTPDLLAYADGVDTLQFLSKI